MANGVKVLIGVFLASVSVNAETYTYKKLGKGECMDGRNVRVDHCYDRGMFIRTQEDCEKLCNNVKSCGAIEFGRDSYYNCAIYPTGGDASGVDRRLTCYMATSDGPVRQAKDFNHGGYCYLREKGTTTTATAGTTTVATTTEAPTTQENPKFALLDDMLKALAEAQAKAVDDVDKGLSKELDAITSAFNLLSGEVKDLTKELADNKVATAKVANDLVAATEAHTAFQGSVQDSQDVQAALNAAVKEQLEGLEAKLEAALAAPAASGADSNRCAGTCAPEVSSGDGENLALKARGGTVVFESAECKETDLCALAQNVKALLSKYGL